MRIKHRINAIIAGLSIIELMAFSANSVSCYAIENTYTTTGYTNTITVDSDEDDSNESYNTFEIGEYELNISELSLAHIANSKEIPIIASNRYGDFNFVGNSSGSVQKYKYGNANISDKYLIKGIAKFSKVDISFDGYFLVDNTLKGRKKGQITLYKGNASFPNGDKYSGVFDSGRYYSSGTYTWKNGMSYKGIFTKTNKLGSNALRSGKQYYGYFYLDSKKKNYLYIRFVNSVPRDTGYYYENGSKYVVKYDKYGNCIYTAKSSK